MSVPARLALFAVLLVAAFGVAAVAGGAIDPSGADEDAPSHAAADPGAGGSGDAAHGEEPEAAHGSTEAAEPASLPGLAAAQDGLRLVPATDRLAAGRRAVRFRIVDEHGEPVRDFDLAHEKRMHLIVVRRDLRGFQHLHPTMGDDGTWSVTADLALPGTHRIYADFTIDGEQHTLGTDLHVAGDFRPAALPAAATTSSAGDGIEVRLRRDGGRLAFSVLRDGRPADDELEPYLGARGHLVTLRTADLAYLHTHADGDELAFETDLPSAGAYRLWVQFQLDGVVRTAAFTMEVSR